MRACVVNAFARQLDGQVGRFFENSSSNVRHHRRRCNENSESASTVISCLLNIATPQCAVDVPQHAMKNSVISCIRRYFNSVRRMSIPRQNLLHLRYQHMQHAVYVGARTQPWFPIAPCRIDDIYHEAMCSPSFSFRLPNIPMQCTNTRIPRNFLHTTSPHQGLPYSDRYAVHANGRGSCDTTTPRCWLSLRGRQRKRSRHPLEVHGILLQNVRVGQSQTAK